MVVVVVVVANNEVQSDSLRVQVLVAEFMSFVSRLTRMCKIGGQDIDDDDDQDELLVFGWQRNRKSVR